MNNPLYLGVLVLLASSLFSAGGVVGICLQAGAIIFFGYCAGYQSGKDRALRDNRDNQKR